MPSPKLSVRVSDETYATLLKLAEIEKKTMTELVKELIEQGLGKRQNIEQDLLDEIRMLRMESGEFIARAIKASAHAAYYSKMACEGSDETAHYITTNPKLEGGQILDSESKAQRAQARRKKMKEIAEGYLNQPFEKL